MLKCASSQGSNSCERETFAKYINTLIELWVIEFEDLMSAIKLHNSDLTDQVARLLPP